MKKILITGAGSYVGENVRKYIMQTAGDQFVIDAVDTFGDNWKPGHRLQLLTADQ